VFRKTDPPGGFQMESAAPETVIAGLRKSAGELRVIGRGQVKSGNVRITASLDEAAADLEGRADALERAANSAWGILYVRSRSA
jgi:hypothetical protein